MQILASIGMQKAGAQTQSLASIAVQNQAVRLGLSPNLLLGGLCAPLRSHQAQAFANPDVISIQELLIQAWMPPTESRRLHARRRYQTSCRRRRRTHCVDLESRVFE